MKPEELVAADDLTSVKYDYPSKQLPDDELGIGTPARLLLMDNDEVGGTQVERNFFSVVRHFYKDTVAKIIAEFPFKDQTLADLKFLDPTTRLTVIQASVLCLFLTFQHFFPRSMEAGDELVAEFLDYRFAPDDQLVLAFDVTVNSSPDQFWQSQQSQEARGHQSAQILHPFTTGQSASCSATWEC